MLRIQVEEQRELVLEVQFDRPDRAIAVLGQDDLGDVLVLRFLVVVSSRYKKETMSASCSRAPDSRRSLSMGRLSCRLSTLRLSWDKAMSGTFSSRARALREREISEISCCRLSALRPCMSCR